MDRHPGYKKCGVVTPDPSPPRHRRPCLLSYDLATLQLGRTPASRKRRPTSTDGDCEGGGDGKYPGDRHGRRCRHGSGSPKWVTKNARRRLMRQSSRGRLRFTVTENCKVRDDRHYIITRAAESESRPEIESVGVDRFGLSRSRSWNR